MFTLVHRLVFGLLLSAPFFQEAPPPLDLATLLSQFVVLAGAAGLIAALINTGKFFGAVKDGQAPTISLLLNLAGFLAFVLLRLFRPDVDVSVVDQALENVAQILVLGLGLIAQLGSTKVAHVAMRGLPIVGTSYSHPAGASAETASPQER